MELAYYWSSIPIGPENAITYEQLCFKWHVSRRHVRRILHELSMWDNGDGFVLIRSSQYVGFYRTDDRAEIERFKRETISRATKTFAPLRKINRILGVSDNQLSIEF